MIKTSEIEDVYLNTKQVHSSITRHLGIEVLYQFVERSKLSTKGGLCISHSK
ncbi:DUF4172 domain-containing protein [Moraxella nonliquefaciens]|uniref:DUF4172 domain-containing protein n=1 Tax=Moraxella nonliquefaciens TaxID=478 RepID=UPI001C12CC22